jgi:hypothetical protein
VTWRRCEREWEMLDENERRMMEQHNRNLGFEGYPVYVVYGEGYASRSLIFPFFR